MPPKSSTSAGSEKSFSAGDIVLGKLKGYPAWPAQVVDNDKAPPKVRKDKPSKSKSTYLVQFFPTGDYAWLGARDMTTLAEKEIDAFLSGTGKKKADLVQAYKTAQNPEDWRAQQEAALADFQAYQEQLAANDDEDQLASDGEAGKKRKRKSDAGKKDAAGGSKAKKAKTAASSKPQAEDDKAEDKPATKKAKPASDSDSPELRQVRDWRHKLQKAFLSSNKSPQSEDMTKCKEYFDAMETFDMKKEWLTETKLAKVLKRIATMKDGQVPDNDQYNFRERSSALATKWAQSTDADGTPAPAAPSEPSEAAPAPAPAAPTASEPAKTEAGPTDVPSSASAPAAPPAEAKTDDKPVEANGVAASTTIEQAPAPTTASAAANEAPKPNGTIASNEPENLPAPEPTGESASVPVSV